MDTFRFLLLAPYFALAAPVRWLVPEWAAVYVPLIENGWVLTLLFLAPPAALVILKKYRFGGIRRPKLTWLLLGIYSAFVVVAFSPLVGGHNFLLFFAHPFNYVRLDVEGKGTYYRRNDCDWMDGIWSGTVLYQRHAWLPIMRDVKWSQCTLEIPGKQTSREIHVTDAYTQCDLDREPCQESFTD